MQEEDEYKSATAIHGWHFANDGHVTKPEASRRNVLLGVQRRLNLHQAALGVTIENVRITERPKHSTPILDESPAAHQMHNATSNCTFAPGEKDEGSSPPSPNTPPTLPVLTHPPPSCTRSPQTIRSPAGCYTCYLYQLWTCVVVSRSQRCCGGGVVVCGWRVDLSSPTALPTRPNIDKCGLTNIKSL